MIQTIQWAARICLAILVFALFVGGSQPIAGSLFPPPWDKIVHVIFYGGLLYIATKAFPRTHLFLLLLGVMGIGILDEIHQKFVPGRQPGLDDLLADFIGCAIVYIGFKSWAYWRHRR